MNRITLEHNEQIRLFSWQLLLIRGIAALAFAVVALLVFGATFTLLTWFFVAYVFFDGIYSALRLSEHGSGACPRVLIAIKSLVDFAACIAVILLTTTGSQLYTLLTIFAWIAIVGVLEGIWVIRNVRNKELVLIIGSSAYLALAVALQMVFALAPAASPDVYRWIVIGFSAAFSAAMFGMSWALRRNMLKQEGKTSATAVAH